jgi:DNA-binding NarL/FixJ family response regulator
MASAELRAARIEWPTSSKHRWLIRSTAASAPQDVLQGLVYFDLPVPAGRSELQVICEASDGSEAVQLAEELKPDLVVLDIGLPKLNGIEAARRIRQLSPNSKIIFLSQNNSLEVVQEALSTGALTYAEKAHAGSELLSAVNAVLTGVAEC